MKLRNKEDVLGDTKVGDVLCGVQTRMISMEHRLGMVKVAKGVYIYASYPETKELPKTGTIVSVRVQRVGQGKRFRGIVKEVGIKNNVVV